MLSDVTENYGGTFYDRQRAGSLNSANIILPIVFDLVRPRSVLDVGCGVGTWLSIAKRLGCERCVGLEGAWIKTQRLEDAALEVRVTDLEQPVDIGDRYDLAMSLEVAEHLRPDRADSFVADICKAADVVLFSAAMPGQDGDGHQNEQWPSYWAERFVRHGYFPLDVIRPLISAEASVEVWYRTNVVLYARPAQAAAILANAKGRHLANLDLPGQIEIVGLKRAATNFLDSTKTLVDWTIRRAQQRLTR